MAQSDMAQSNTLSKGRKFLYAALVAIVFFGGVEVALRLGGFERSTRVERMQFAFRVDDVNQRRGGSFLERDETLFWKPVPNNLGHNSKGTYGPEFDSANSSGTFRIVCLGDSCTHLGGTTYPDHLRTLLNRDGIEQVEVINTGVVGYSSFQGLARLKTEVANWKPDLITVYFGWNDHWLARGVPDSEQANRSTALSSLAALADRSRIYQLLILGRQKWIPYSDQHRVSAGEYEENLREIARLGKEMDAKVVFITAPHALNLGIPDHLTENGEVSDPKRLVDLHRAYNDVVRQVASEQDVTILDLDREFDTFEKSNLFTEDHIHLSAIGRTLTASLLAREFQRAGILPQDNQLPAAEAVNHLAEGDRFFAKHQLSDSQQQYKQSLAIHPNFVKAHERLAKVLAEQGRAEQSLKHYREVSRLDPHFPHLHDRLNEAGVSFSAKRRFQDAVSFFEEAVRIKPDFAKAYNNWGIALGGLGRFEEAIPHYQNALDIQPDYAKAHFNWGIALASQGRLEDAAAQFRKAVVLMPDNAAARQSLHRAEALLQQQKKPTVR